MRSNLYAFSLNNPVLFTDPLGLEPINRGTNFSGTCGCDPNQFDGIDFNGVDIYENANFAKLLPKWNPATFPIYAQFFRDGGLFDYGEAWYPGVKDPELEQHQGAINAHRFGNFNFGVMMAASGFPEQEALWIAGFVRQVKGRNPERGEGSTGIPFGIKAKYPFGNIPGPAKDIQSGYDFYQRCIR